MAFAIALIGLMVGGAVTAFGPIRQQNALQNTNNAMNQVEQALMLFVTRNGRLPCPADGSLTPASLTYGTAGTDYGVEQLNAAGNGCNVTTTDPVTNSVIPWVTLGLDETYSFDGWDHRFAYFPSDTNLIPGVNTLVDNDGGNGDGCVMYDSGADDNQMDRYGGAPCDTVNEGLPATYPYGNYIAVYSISSGACSTELTTPNSNELATGYDAITDSCGSVATPLAVTSDNVSYDGYRAAYVLISHGPSGWYGWTRAGKQLLPPGAAGFFTLKFANSNGSAGTAGNKGFVTGLSSTNRSLFNYFDDIVRYATPSFLVQQCGGGACGQGTSP